MKKLKYNFGSNNKVIGEDYINVDGLELPNVNIVHNLTTFPYDFAQPNSADEIVMIEVLEHIPFSQTYLVLTECHKILKKGGVLKIQVPACDKMMEMFMNKEICECVSHKPQSDIDARGKEGCFGCGGKGRVHPTRWLYAFTGAQKHKFDAHLNIFTKDRLEEELKKARFENIDVHYDTYEWKLIASATK